MSRLNSVVITMMGVFTFSTFAVEFRPLDTMSLDELQTELDTILKEEARRDAVKSKKKLKVERLNDTDKKIIYLTGGLTGYEAKSRGGVFSAPETNMIIKTDKLLNLIKERPARINIVLNSTGGILEYATGFLTAIDLAKIQGIKIVCYNTGLVASLATIIFAECSERIALDSARVMWHSISVSGRMTLNIVGTQKLLDRLKKDNKKWWKTTREKFDYRFYKKHFDAETVLPIKYIIKHQLPYNKLVTKVISNLIINN